MSSVNKVTIVGRVGRDAEVRFTPSGTSVVNFSVATTETWKDKQTGEKKERTEWHNIQAWGKLAEICGEYVKKGMLVYLEGSIRSSEYEAKDGTMKHKTDIVANEVKFLSKAGDSSGQNQGAKPVPKPLPSGDDLPL